MAHPGAGAEVTVEEIFGNKAFEAKMDVKILAPICTLHGQLAGKGGAVWALLHVAVHSCAC